MAGFSDFFTGLKNHKKQPKIEPSKEANKCAYKFIESVRKLNKTSGINRARFPDKTWSREFEQLLKSVSGDYNRVFEVLVWYVDHCTDDYIPKITSAQAFRNRFVQVEDSFQRWKMENPAIKVRKKFQRIALESFGIAKQTSKGYFSESFVRNFPLALQLTHDNYKQFLDWLWSWSDPNTEGWDKNSAGMPNLYCTYFTSPEEFTLHWWKRYDSWFLTDDHRQINPLSLVFDLHSKKSKIRTRSLRWFDEIEQHFNLPPDTMDRLVKTFLKVTPIAE